MTIPERIKELRKNRNLTQSELADLAGVTKTAISNWERGSYSPDSVNLKKLAEALGTTVAYLLGETDLWTRYGDVPEHDRTKEEWHAIQDQIIRRSEAQREAVQEMGRYTDPDLSIYEIIGDLAKMQSSTKKFYKHYEAQDWESLNSQLDAYKALLNILRTKQNIDTNS